MRLMHRAKRTGVCVGAWDKLNGDPRYELVEVDAKGNIRLSRYTKVDSEGKPEGPMQPAKPPSKSVKKRRAAQKQTALPALKEADEGLDAALDDLLGGV